MFTLKGTPEEIGEAYGKQYKREIFYNIKELVNTEKIKLLLNDINFCNWIQAQEKTFNNSWPWIINEMKSVARTADISFEEILMLNFRAWQYDFAESERVSECCSSFAITLKDGTVACAGALDDPVQFYCGPIRFIPEKGNKFITFPITGTSWGNRGMNSKGLSIAISSQILPGITKNTNSINQDLAIRIILQTCDTVNEVRKFCRKYSFNMNILCVDSNGEIFCAHQTTAGLYELPTDKFAVLTNHISDDEYIYYLSRKGLTKLSESSTTRFRRGNMLRFMREKNSKCEMEEILSFLEKTSEDDLGIINNKSTIYLTYNNPQKFKNYLWIKQPKSIEHNFLFEMHKIEE